MFLSDGCYSTDPPSIFVSMDETAVTFEGKSKLNLHHTDARAVLVRGSTSINRRLTASLLVACCIVNLPLFQCLNSNQMVALKGTLTSYYHRTYLTVFKIKSR